MSWALVGEKAEMLTTHQNCPACSDHRTAELLLNRLIGAILPQDGGHRDLKLGVLSELLSTCTNTSTKSLTNHPTSGQFTAHSGPWLICLKQEFCQTSPSHRLRNQDLPPQILSMRPGLLLLTGAKGWCVSAPDMKKARGLLDYVIQFTDRIPAHFLCRTPRACLDWASTFQPLPSL